MTAEVKVEEKRVETEVVIAAAVAPVEEETTVKAVVEEEVKDVTETVEKETKVEDESSKPEEGVEKSASFKEESDFFSELKESERKALSDLKSKLEEAIVENTLFKKKKETPVKEKKEEVKQELEVEKKETEKAEEVKTEAVVVEEAPKEVKTEAVVAEETPKEVKTEAIVEEAPQEVKTEAVVAEETPKEVKTEAIVVEEAPKEVKIEAESVEEKKTEAAVTEDAKAETIQEEKEAEEEVVDKDIELWGVPLLPSKGSAGTDVILLKFLRARDFKVNEAFEMLKKTLIWRKQNNIESILEEDFGEDLASATYMSGVDRESHPVFYTVHSVFEKEELYQTTFGSEKNREKFLRWRFQLMEKGIKKLDLKPGGVTSLLQIHDLKNSPGLSRKELRVAIKQVIEALQDNYPEFVSRNIFINVPFWFYALNTLLSPFLTQRTKSKFVVARPAKATETLIKYIPVEELPVQYGGFKRENDTEFTTETVSEVFIKPGTSETIEIPAPEIEATTLVWDIAVLGWEVNYKEEFVPTDEGSYTIIVQKMKKIGANEGVIRNSFKNSESGKIVLTIDNVSGKKKRVLYRYKNKTEASS